MASVLSRSPRFATRERSLRGAMPALALTVLGLVLGLGIARGYGLIALAAVISGGFMLYGVRHWQRALLGLLVFLPYSGLLIIAVQSEAGLGALAKDFFFVIPAYVGFAITRLRSGQPLGIPGFPVGLVLLFTAIVVLQALNPTVPSMTVGLLGAKVWLMYIPMAFLGYHFVRTRADLRTLLGLMVAVGILPLVIGLVEAVLVNTGQAELVYGLYGDAAQSATQDFANVGGDSASILRVPSTFSFVAQYYLFTVVMLVTTFAYWHGFLAREGSRSSAIGATAVVLAAVASLSSGARGALLAVPVLIVLMLLLEGTNVRSWLWLPGITLLLMAFASSLFGTSLGPLLRDLQEHATFEFTFNTVQGFSGALSRTLVGLGTGVDTLAARHVLSDENALALVGGKIQESWWVKALLELGIAGLAVTVTMAVTVAFVALRAHSRLRDPALRSISAGMIALIAFVLLSNFKGSYLDLDPTNVVFWLFVGIVLKLPSLQETSGSRRGG